jgi:transcriptional regulator with XRE-family HTH domain
MLDTPKARTMIPVKEFSGEWRISLAAAIIQARTHAGLSQGQLAERMEMTQALIARLESGRVKPSTRTLERLAEATGMRLRILFEPVRGGDEQRTQTPCG